MSLLLHLSDLHLGEPTPEDVLDDHKSKIVPPEERTTRQSLIERAIVELGQELDQTGTRLDAIVITGDITSRNSEDGFQRLSALLAKLGNCCPPPERIVVIPGNHDVARATPPGSRERYAHFLRYTRQHDQHYITPLLEGIDLDAKGQIQSAAEHHYLLSPRRDWLIVPMNSANYCQSIEPLESLSADLWRQLPDLISKSSQATPEAIRRDLDRLRLHDVARISDDQFDGVQNLLRIVDQQLRAEDIDPMKLVRIALIHHHLLPVSLAEEFKSFESITNLGLLRAFLRDHGFNLVLHGHKHQGLIYYDDIPDVQGDGPPRRVLVVSGATVDARNNHQEAGRLIKIDANEYIPRACITPIPGLRPAMRLNMPTLSSRVYLLPQQDGNFLDLDTQPTLIRGKTLDELYTRLRYLCDVSAERGSQNLHNIVCQLEDSSTAYTLPTTYPHIDEGDRAAWLEDIVNWWQRPKSKLSDQWRFTHGSRIYAYGEVKKIDQVKNVIKILQSRENSSRAVITLLLPSSDEIDNEATKFPSFCLVQFVIRRGSKREPYLDCVAYFRKQELRYWWPINMVEIARLQKKIRGNLLQRMPELSLGTITTMTAIGSAGQSLPKVAVPAIDRALDDKEDLLWSLMYALFWPEMPNREEQAEQWKYFLNDLVPPQNPDPDGVAIAIDGLEYILNLGKRLFEYHRSEPAKNLLDSLGQLIKLNKRHVKDASSKDLDSTMYTEWREDVEQLVERIKEDIATLLEGP